MLVREWRSAMRLLCPMDTSPSFTPLDNLLIAWIRSAFPMGPNVPVPGPLGDEQWQALLERSNLQGTSPLLYAALQTRNFANVPGFAIETLQTIYRGSALSGALAQRELQALLTEFAVCRIDVLVLKGAALCKWLYAHPETRPFGDLDLLIRPGDRRAVTELFVRRNYREASASTADFHDTFYCETLFVREVPPFQSVDLHWQIINPMFYRNRVNIDWFWAHTLPLAGETVIMRTLDPTAQFVHLTLHLALHHGNAPRLIHLYDLALLIQKHGAAIDWHSAAASVKTAGLARPVYNVLRQVQAAWKMAPQAETLALFEPDAGDISERIAFQFLSTDHREGSVLADALSIPGARNKLRYALAHLIPAPAYMRQRYNLPPDAFMPYYYARRFGESTGKFVRSVWSAFVR